MFFVCYILDNNNTCDCLKYDYSSDILRESGNYLENCLPKFSSLDIISYNIKNKIEFILYCFISETEINLVKLNENFTIIQNGENRNYSINNSLINNCKEFYLSYLFYKSDKNDIYIFGNCDNIIIEYELKKIVTIDDVKKELGENIKLGENLSNEKWPNFNLFINNFEVGNTYEIKGKDYILSLRPMNSTILGNSTHVDFTECEKILRNIYEIESESILTFVQLELNNKDNNTLVNKVEYMVFDNNKIKLDLGLCRDTNIKIVYSIKDFILQILKFMN